MTSSNLYEQINLIEIISEMTALDAIHARINSFTEKKDGWKGQGSVAVPLDLIEIAHKFCDILAESNQLPENEGMLEEGGIYLVWKTGRIVCLITHQNNAPWFDILYGADDDLCGPISAIEVFAEQIKNFLNTYIK